MGAFVVAGPLRLEAEPPLERALRLVELLASRGASALIVSNWSLDGRALDPFVLASALAQRSSAPLRLGAMLELGEGRAASVGMRELACLERLAPGRAGHVLAGRGARLEQATAVAAALLSGAPATAGGELEGIVEAPNLPPPGPAAAAGIVLHDRGAARARRLDGSPLSIRAVTGLDDLGSLAGDELVHFEELAAL